MPLQIAPGVWNSEKRSGGLLILVLARLHQIARALLCLPHFGVAADCLGEADRHFRQDAGLAVDDVAECLAGDPERARPR